MQDTLRFLDSLASWHKRSGAFVAAKHIEAARDHIRATLAPVVQVADAVNEGENIALAS